MSEQKMMREDMRANAEAVATGLAAQGVPPHTGIIIIFFHTKMKISQMAVAMPSETADPKREVAEVLKSEAQRAVMPSDNLVIPAASLPPDKLS